MREAKEEGEGEGAAKRRRMRVQMLKVWSFKRCFREWNQRI